MLHPWSFPALQAQTSRTSQHELITSCYCQTPQMSELLQRFLDMDYIDMFRSSINRGAKEKELLQQYTQPKSQVYKSHMLKDLQCCTDCVWRGTGKRRIFHYLWLPEFTFSTTELISHLSHAWIYTVDFLEPLSTRWSEPSLSQVTSLPRWAITITLKWSLLYILFLEVPPI